MTDPVLSVSDRIIAVLARVRKAPVNPTPDSTMVADLGFDSLTLLEVVAELEDEFGIYFPLNEVAALTTFGKVVERVSTLLEEQNVHD
jgi:acyl carrier protein